MMQLYYIEFRAMGCRVEIQLETDADGLKILNTMPARLEDYEAILSRFRVDSELSHLNRQAGQWVSVSETLFKAVKHAKHGARRTDGFYNPLILNQMVANGYVDSFDQVHQPVSIQSQPAEGWQKIELMPESYDIRLPANSAIDLGGVAKGWVASEIAKDLSHYGACLVNIGGDITVTDAPTGQAGWEIEIDDPCSGTNLLTLSLTNTTVITSGVDYRRWTTADGINRHHIIDPRTGYPAQTDVLTVTVIHPHAPTAEVFAKAVLLMGSQAGLAWLYEHWRTKALVIRRDGCVMATRNFQNLINKNSILYTEGELS